MKRKEELHSFEPFSVDSEPERPRHNCFNYVIEDLNATKIVEKLDQFFNNLSCATEVNLLFGSP